MGADEADIPKGEKAAAQPGGKRRAKPPVTIDLQAESVAPEPSDAPPAEPAPEREGAAGLQPDDPPQPSAAASSEPPPSQPFEPPPRPASPGLGTLAAAGAVGGLVVLALGFGLQAAGILPTPGRDIALQAHATGADLTAKLAALDQRVQSIEATSGQRIADRAMLDDMAKRLGAGSSDKSLAERVGALEAKTATLEGEANEGGGAATERSVDALTARVAELEARPPIDNSAVPAPPVAASEPQRDITALEQRVTALEAKVALVASAPAATAATAAAHAAESFEKADAIAALRAASADGGNFGSELAVVGSFGVAGAQVAELAPLAEKNVPSGSALIGQFPDVANRILAAGDSAEGGLVGQLLAYGRSFVRVRPSEPIAGDQPEAIVSRIEGLLKGDDLAAAHDEWDKLPDAGKAVSKTWADELTERATIDRLVEELASALGASAGSG